MRRPIRIAVFVTVAMAFCTVGASAEHASVTLSFVNTNKAAATCPDEATFRNLVAARLGYDPFATAGTRALSVAFERAGKGVVGSLQLRGDPQERSVQRTLRAPVAECFELATSLALVAAVAVDPDALERGTPAPAPAPQPLPPPLPSPPVALPLPPPQAVSVTPTQASPRSFRLAFSGLWSSGIVPVPVFGARAGAGLGFGAWSLDAEGWFFGPGARQNPLGSGYVSAFAFGAGLVPCVAPFDTQSWAIELCVAGAVGALRATAKHVTRAAPTNKPYVSVGPRLATTLELFRGWGLGASAELPVALSRLHLHIEEAGESQQVWVAPRLGFIGAVSLIARLD